MAKDPAILWYYNDYLSGTEEMTFEEQGAYMRLLCKQADKGHLSIESIKRVLRKSFDKLWPVLKEKFEVDSEGLFFNNRIEKEKDRRQNFLKRQSENGKRGGRKSKENIPSDSQNKPMVKPDESNIENENRDERNKGVQGEVLGSEFVSKIARLVWEDQKWKEAICMGQTLSMDDLKRWMAQFNSSIANDIVIDFAEPSYKKMFGGWLNKQRSKGYKLPESGPKPSSPRLEKLTS